MQLLTDLFALTGPYKIIVLLLIAIFGHLVVKLIQALSTKFSKLSKSNRAKTVASLTVSVLIFAIYFVVFGITLQEVGVSPGTYIASASVIGIAVGFGTQNVIQDVINGLTIILADLFTVGNMVEISGQTGIVQEVTMRFVVLKNPLGAKVYIPTRTVTNVINYPRGYIRCLVDINLPSETLLRQFRENSLEQMVHGFVEQFPGILRAEPEIENIRTTISGKNFIRIKFRIWPGRGSAIESTFKHDIFEALKIIDENADANTVTINYEVSS